MHLIIDLKDSVKDICTLICSVPITWIFNVLQGEHIGTTEATETFFAMTKLFQCKDVS